MFGFNFTDKKTCECQQSLSLAGDLFTRCKCEPAGKSASPPEQYGASCARCGEYNHYAAASADYACYSCRTDPFR